MQHVWAYQWTLFIFSTVPVSYWWTLNKFSTGISFLKLICIHLNQSLT